MEEAINNITKVLPSQAEGITLIDTCAFVHHFEHPEKIARLKRPGIGITSFNLAELLYIEHKLPEKVKEGIKRFLKHEDLTVVDIPVFPGDKDGELSYVKDIDPEILNIVPDPSDAVLYATAVKMNSDIVTRDKHHIYTQLAEQFANKHGVEVRNKI
ncbi:PIN domain-containing protein [Candidatus Woesearchaeota archaeon]|nr:PIN domain-containing protein [Candidatus Woesearchaeota archaeon]